jgi:predicted ArsR family transcriptional regulator
VNSEQQRHRVLAGISRSRLLAVLHASDRPMAIRDLADAVDLHPNTAREHLDLLVDAGLVRRETAPAAGRGRPGLRYVAEPQERTEDPRAYRALASVLATELARRPDAGPAARSAGERWGQAAARALPGVGVAEPDAVDRLVDLLDDAGFAPSRSTATPDEIELHRCPFGPLAHERGDVVCNVHLGLMRGALRELGAPLDAVSLQPFVEPDLCVAHLRARHD